MLYFINFDFIIIDFQYFELAEEFETMMANLQILKLRFK